MTKYLRDSAEREWRLMHQLESAWRDLMHNRVLYEQTQDYVFDRITQAIADRHPPSEEEITEARDRVFPDYGRRG